jgi:hypothetical protein
MNDGGRSEDSTGCGYENRSKIRLRYWMLLATMPRLKYAMC